LILKNHLKKVREHRRYNLFNYKIYFEEILLYSGIMETDAYEQHGETSRFLHSVAVSYYSYRLALFLRMRDHLKDLVRGALAHDYFLYKTKNRRANKTYKKHGRTHPEVALMNAELDFNLTDIERDIISKHMFPLTLSPPKYKESAIVTVIDKVCAVYEFFKRKNPYPSVREDILDEQTYFLPSFWETEPAQ
jgi:hypothetical protein